MKNFILNICKKYSHAVILLYYFVILKWFSYLEAVVVPRYTMFSKIDHYIPFVPVFVVPYLIWFAYIAVAMTYLGLTSRQDFIKLSIFMFSGMSICMVIYTFLPNGQDLRPEVVAGNDVFSQLVRMIYEKDTPTNSAPSMHVLNSIAVHLAIVNCENLKSRKVVKASSFVLMVLIIMSTVMIKQHSVLDGIYAIILSMILYMLIYKVKYKALFSFGKAYEESNNSL